jgi:hypothetical protein
MMYGRLTVNPVSAAWNTVARFDDYQSAQRAVDRLSDDGFRSSSSLADTSDPPEAWATNSRRGGRSRSVLKATAARSPDA